MSKNRSSWMFVMFVLVAFVSLCVVAPQGVLADGPQGGPGGGFENPLGGPGDDGGGGNGGGGTGGGGKGGCDTLNLLVCRQFGIQECLENGTLGCYWGARGDHDQPTCGWREPSDCDNGTGNGNGTGDDTDGTFECSQVCLSQGVDCNDIQSTNPVDQMNECMAKGLCCVWNGTAGCDFACESFNNCPNYPNCTPNV